MKDVPFSSPSGPRDGRIQYAPTTEYVRPFKKLSCFRPLRGRGVGCMRYAPTTGYVWPFKNCLIFVPFGTVCEAYSIRPYDRVRMILRNTDAIFQLNTYGPLKNCPVFVPYGAARWAYSIRPYNRVRAILRNTDAIFRPGTCGPSKTVSFSSPSGPSVRRIQYAPTTGYVRFFKILMRFSN